AHDIVEAAAIAQTDLFAGGGVTESKVEQALDAVREKFGEAAVMKGRGFGKKVDPQGPSKAD
ncbi:MAG: hypothetical protein ACKVH7_15235, partial [Alphaproteobacteria bacterium]